ncbi:MAG TPA: protein translocase subunit SecD [Alphaproteobacteria bacterium]|nr:protein translocase subunit SecD [Alphaproteobacteria bacterium]
MLIVTAIGFLYAMPNALSPEVRAKLPGWLPHQTVNLGLDLQGGAQLLLRVEIDKALADFYEGLTDGIRKEFREDNIGYRNLSAQPDRLVLTLRDKSQMDAARKKIKKLDQNLEIKTDDDRITMTLSDQGLKERRDQGMEQSIEIVRRRIDETGTKEPVIARQGSDRIIVQLPGVDDPQRIKDILGKTAKLSFNLVDDEASANSLVAPPGSMRLPMQNDEAQFLSVKQRALITGDMLRDARTGFDQNGQPVVSFAFDGVGARRFADATTQNVGKPFAILLDNKILSAPVIREPITGGSGQISGNFTTQEANDLALLLRAGALPAPLTVIEERTVGPTLGADSIASGRDAALIGMAAVSVLVIVSYALWGVFATIALAVNMVFIFAMLSIFGATLTLPGIAGIVLTIGMAVDANVLIFERIREEWMAGRTQIAAIDAGFARAMSAVVDTNLTALISALALMSFGVGPVRGFAVTLTFGVITSLFTAVMLTRLIIMAWLHYCKPKELPFPRKVQGDIHV